jgi:hypothetical protein
MRNDNERFHSREIAAATFDVKSQVPKEVGYAVINENIG